MIAKRIKELRNLKRISQRELSEKLSVSQQTVGSWETGRSEPNTEMIKKLARFFDVSTDYLLGNNEKTHKSPDWATEADRIDLDKLLQSNTPMGYGGMSMAPEDKEKVRNVIEGIYWDRLKKIREEGKK
ncbi:helix-turn-helix domain-containing protein [Lactiplantibacillus plantarum]|uniref:helix-turn-helix domain-containing protein n=1 Tax=Lactiplantibacillus plantarum TaxID=1590 RepID=UPI0007B54DD8|nr:helix-turn-helix transcriptional regulator [Lactiplantibacillus plantarum]KZU69523.1 Cro-like phage transcriptional repressorprotein [Lactiplantibacillus plantarum]QAT29202.1 helix-turn-helix domain-containing protein [Lactiplantibacillus plantarum]QAT34066.1 helix-turn-helix domain-containing protein [Lactiplantibacillus plantarum]